MGFQLFAGTDYMKKSTTGLLLIGSPEQELDIRYATGFNAPDPVMFLRVRGHDHLAVPAMEAERARRVARNCRVWTWDELRSKAGASYRLRELVLELLKRTGVQQVLVPANFPVGVADALRASRIRVNVSKDHLFPERSIKRREEVRWIKQAQQAAAAALEHAVSVLKASRITTAGQLKWRGRLLSSDLLRMEIQQILLTHDCVGFETIVACGPASADPHERGHGLLCARQPIVLDIFPRSLSSGYWGDLTRTVVKGQPSALLQSMYEAVKEAHAAALAVVRPKKFCRTAHLAAAGVFEKKRFRTDTSAQPPKGFIHSTGHGVGLQVHEAPSISLRPGRFQAGNVVTIEPGLYEPGVGGVRIEDVVEVTDSGWRWVVPVRDVFRV